jgi:arginyl-tRNA synthetase
MLQSQIDHLVASFREAATAVGVDALTSSTANVVLDRPRQQDHGDVACNLALQIARPLKRPPREVAASLLEAFLRIEAGRLVARGETAGPGFINLWLKPEAKQAVVGAILRDAEAFGNRTQPAADAVLLEFVSANPTGPLHVGHGRQAALGDVLGNILASQGWRVVREFYYNDAGAQIHNLALSVQARCRGIAPQDDQFPADGYRGDYISDIAQDYLTAAAWLLLPWAKSPLPVILRIWRLFVASPWPACGTNRTWICRHSASLSIAITLNRHSTGKAWSTERWCS